MIFIIKTIVNLHISSRIQTGEKLMERVKLIEKMIKFWRL